MVRSSLKCVLAVLVLAGLSIAQQPVGCAAFTPEQQSLDVPLLTRILNAMGGKQAVAQVRSIRYEMTSQRKTPYGDATGQVSQTRIFPDTLTMDTQSAAGKIYVSVSPTESYMQASNAPKTALPGVAVDEVKNTLKRDRYWVAQHFGDGSIKINEVGKDKISGKSVTILEVVNQGLSAKWFVEDATGLLVRTLHKANSMAGMKDTVVDYSDWRRCGDLIVPFKHAIAENGEPVATETVSAAEINPDTRATRADTVAATSSVESSDDQVKEGAGGKKVGGNWWWFRVTNKMNDSVNDLFELAGTYGIPSGPKPTLQIWCQGGKFKHFEINTEVVLGSSDSRNWAGVPQLWVQARVDNEKPALKAWNISDDFKSLSGDPGTLKRLLKGQRFLVQFNTFAEGTRLAEFNVGKIDAQRLAATCGL